MKVVGFEYFKKNKRKCKVKIYCFGRVFKPLFVSMSVALSILLLNLFTGNFFWYLRASIQNFVENFVSIF